jgi:hypothetical protein
MIWWHICRCGHAKAEQTARFSQKQGYGGPFEHTVLSLFLPFPFVELLSVCPPATVFLKALFVSFLIHGDWGGFWLVGDLIPLNPHGFDKNKQGLRWYGSQSKLLLKTENSITTNQLQEGTDNRGKKKAADSFIKLQTIMQLFSLKLLMSFHGNTKHMLAN